MGDSGPPKVNQTAKPVTPGWNDPPDLSYNVISTPDSQTSKRKLNRRVPFPLFSGTSDTSQSQENNLPPNLPPKLVNKANIVSSTLNDEVASDCGESIFDSKGVFEEVLENINVVLADAPNKTDIQKRIDIMTSLWNENKFPVNMQKTLLDLSKNLRENKMSEANTLQMELMVKYASLCGTWMVGIRQLIKISK